MCVKYILSVGTVEPFNEPVLHGPSRLGVLDIYPLGLAPSCEIKCKELGPVVHPDPFGPAVFPDGPLQYLYHAHGGETELGLHTDGLPVEVIDDVERPEPSPVHQ